MRSLPDHQTDVLSGNKTLPATLHQFISKCVHYVATEVAQILVTFKLLSRLCLPTDSSRHPGTDFSEDHLESIMCQRYTDYPYQIDHILSRIKLQ